MSHDAGHACPCQADHRPAPLELNAHHVWPLAMGGPDIPENIAWVCPTAHVNTHELLRLMLAHDTALTWGQVTALYEQPVSRHAFALALTGYRRVRARSMDGGA